MKDHNHGYPLRRVERLKQLEDFELMAKIAELSRLVEQQNRRLLSEHHRNPCPLALSAGKGIDLTRRKRREVGLVERPFDCNRILRRSRT
jgi:hypothetical protein